MKAEQHRSGVGASPIFLQIEDQAGGALQGFGELSQCLFVSGPSQYQLGPNLNGRHAWHPANQLVNLGTNFSHVFRHDLHAIGLHGPVRPHHHAGDAHLFGNDQQTVVDRRGTENAATAQCNPLNLAFHRENLNRPHRHGNGRAGQLLSCGDCRFRLIDAANCRSVFLAAALG